jgi:hypothetical protein
LSRNLRWFDASPLKAARTAFFFEGVYLTRANSTFRLSDNRSDFPPRSFCSPSAAATNRSSSSSPSCLMVLGRSVGKTCRADGTTGWETVSLADTVENKSGGFERLPRLPMRRLCGHCKCAATRWQLALLRCLFVQLSPCTRAARVLGRKPQFGKAMRLPTGQPHS